MKLTFIIYFLLQLGGLAQKADKASLQDIITPFEAKAPAADKVPGMVVAIADGDKPLLIASMGVRKWGSPHKLTIDDKMHLGSCTKAMTATLIGILVDKKKLRWDSTIKQLFPTLQKKIHSGYHQVTIKELLTHRGGIPANAINWRLQENSKLPINSIRKLILEDSLKGKPSERGEFVYSNLSYMIAGLAASQVMDNATWETLMREHIFTPLAMTSAGFGTPGTTKKIEQPWGHFLRLNNKFTAIQLDNAAALGPAGTVHASLQDWIKFAKVFFGGKYNTLVSEATFATLTEPTIDPKNSYAMGWRVAKRNWSKGPVLAHSGSAR